MKKYGKNPTLLKVEYQRPDKKRNLKECFKVLYKNDDGKTIYTEEPAIIPVWIVKPEYRTYTYNKPEERMKFMDKHMVEISKVNDLIVKESGEWGKNIKARANALGDRSILKQLLRWPYVYGADFLPEFYFMHEWFENYPLNYPNLSKCFMDIETDIIDYSPNLDNLKDSAYAPVNVISIVNDEYKEAYQFILRPYVPKKDGLTEEEYQKRYAMYEKQLNDHRKLMGDVDAYINELHREFDSTYGYIDYHLREYEEEIELIADFFRYINSRRPNFVLIWNMRFDIQYLYYRIIALGYDPSSIICPSDIPDARCWFKMDRTTYLIEKQYDVFNCDSYTQYLCSMRNYAAIRKSQHKLRSVALNAIADRELKDKKVEYPENSNIKTFAYDDWIKFLKYNMKDSNLGIGIERKTKDLETYYMRAMKNLTPYSKIFRETHLLRNVREMYFEKEGWVQGNNLNSIDDYKDEEAEKFYGTDEETEDATSPSTGASFKGAINADPLWNDYVGEELLGARTNNLFVNSIDEDMGAFYPSIKIFCNLDPICLLYKAILPTDQFSGGEFKNRSLNQVYEEKDKFGHMRPVDITGEAVNTYVSNNPLTFGYNYFSMPSVADLDTIVTKELGEGT